MASFAHDRRSSDRRSFARVSGQPQRRAFDLIMPFRGQRNGNLANSQAAEARSARAIDELLAATLAAIEHAAAPTLEEVLDMAGRAGIAGPAGEVLRHAKVAELIADRFSIHPVDARACRIYYDLILVAF
jgi:hypothetical protein